MKIPSGVIEAIYTGFIDEHEIELTINFTVGDYGIGSYEFWGEKGYDSRIGVEERWATDAKLVSRSGKSSRPIDPDSEAVESLLDKWVESGEWEDRVEYYNEEQEYLRYAEEEKYYG